MEAAKPLSPVSGKKSTAERGKAVSRNIPLLEKNKNPKDYSQFREKHRKNSMIPVLKIEAGTLNKWEIEKKGKSYLPQKLCCDSCITGKEKKAVEDKLKLIQEKEKCIAEYYLKIENLIQKFHEVGPAESGKLAKSQAPRNPNARKITSEPLVFTQNKTKDDFIKGLENNVHQISEIWFKTSTDFSSSLNNLKSNPTLSPTQFELEKVKIQLAVKQTKSLSLVKTRNIITEVKKLFRIRELIRTELENLFSDDIFKCELFKEGIEKNLPEKGTCTNLKTEKNKKPGGIGDSGKQNNLQIGDSTNNKSSLNFINSQTLPEGEGLKECHLSTPEAETGIEGGKKEISSMPETRPMNVKAWEEELARKKKSITNLNSRIFELQKTCNYHSLLYNQLQAELCHFHEKIQWNEILWKQIGKLKDQIRALQLSNKQLESQKTDLEIKTSKLDCELERLLKVNQLLNQKEFLLKNQEPKKECEHVGNDFKFSKDKCHELKMATDIQQEILAGKQNAINQLKAILDVMKDQENFAQKQISLFQKKIEELEKSAKA